MEARSDDIVIQTETPGDAMTLFRVVANAKVIAEHLTTAQLHILIGDILEEIVRPSMPRKIAGRPGR
jgi:hypothetical protein